MGFFKRVFFSFSLIAILSGSAHAGPIITPVDAEQTIEAIEMNARLLRALKDSIPDHRRRALANKVNRLSGDLERIAEEIENGGGGGFHFGEWLPANGQECTSFCRSRGMETAVSAEGAQCMSGENHAASGMGIIPMVNGCWPSSCLPDLNVPSVSVGRFCYKPGQKRDNDRTDITVGCFCR